MGLLASIAWWPTLGRVVLGAGAGELVRNGRGDKAGMEAPPSQLLGDGTNPLATPRTQAGVATGFRMNPLEAARQSVGATLERGSASVRGRLSSGLHSLQSVEGGFMTQSAPTIPSAEQGETPTTPAVQVGAAAEWKFNPMAAIARSIEMGERTRTRLVSAFAAPPPEPDDGPFPREQPATPAQDQPTCPTSAFALVPPAAEDPSPRPTTQKQVNCQADADADAAPPQELWLTFGEGGDPDELDEGSSGMLSNEPEDEILGTPLFGTTVAPATSDSSAPKPTLTRAQILRQKATDKAAAAKAAARAQMTPRGTQAKPALLQQPAAKLSSVSEGGGGKLGKLFSRKSKKVGKEHGNLAEQSLNLGGHTPGGSAMD